MCNHPGGRLPHEIAGGKAQRLVPWQREDKLGAGGGERWSQPKAINSLSGALRAALGGGRKEREGVRKGRKRLP